MMNNKVLVNLYVPTLEKKYELFLPANRKIGEICTLIAKGLTEISNGYYQITNFEHLYNRSNGTMYNEALLLKNTNIRNGTELVLM